MNDIPEYLKPAIGFAMWHLQQGCLPEDIPWDQDKHGRFKDFSGSLRRRCVHQALRNVAITDLFNAGPDSITVDECRKALGYEGD
jgi:hypothetical protein